MKLSALLRKKKPHFYLMGVEVKTLADVVKVAAKHGYTMQTRFVKEPVQSADAPTGEKRLWRHAKRLKKLFRKAP